MKVLHIATYDNGGAGIAAVRLHKALLGKGVDSKFLCMYSSRKDVPFHYVQPIARPKTMHRLLNMAGLPVTDNQKYWRRLKRLGGNYEIATLPFHDLDMSAHPLVLNADIIHLHFISYFIDIPSFFRKVQKPIVWTMHDMSPFLGCFHYRLDAEANAGTFSDFEHELMAVKKDAYDAHPLLKLATPSAWLMGESMKSPVMAGREHVHIHNCVDTEIFGLKDKAAMRQKHGLPPDARILLFVSENLDNRRKGFDLLTGAMASLPPDDLLLVSIGKAGDPSSLPHDHTAMGPVNDESTLAELYAAADAFVLPSREDNLPNTMVESLCCGTPVIAFAIGGMADEIIPGFNGYLASDIHSKALSDSIKPFLHNHEKLDRLAIHSEACRRYNPDNITERYLEVYKSFSKE